MSMSMYNLCIVIRSVSRPLVPGLNKLLLMLHQ